MKITSRAALAVLAALAAATPAAAAPDRTVELTAEKPSATWASPLSFGMQTLFDDADPGSCEATPLDTCDQTLIDAPDEGTVTVSLPGVDGTTNDWNIYVYAADAAGNPAEQVGASDGTGAETVVVDATWGERFLVIAITHTVVAGAYEAEATYALPEPESDPGATS